MEYLPRRKSALRVSEKQHRTTHDFQCQSEVFLKGAGRRQDTQPVSRFVLRFPLRFP